MWSASSLFPFHQQRERQILAQVRPQREPDIHVMQEISILEDNFGKMITCAGADLKFVKKFTGPKISG